MADEIVPEQPKELPENPGSSHFGYRAEITHARYTSVPLPDPDDLQRYQDLLPDAAERLMTLIEQESKHRQSLEKLAMNAEIDRNKQSQSLEKRGQTCALIISLSFGSLATAAILFGYPTAGTILGTSTVVSIVVAFLASGERNQSRSEKEESGLTKSDK